MRHRARRESSATVSSQVMVVSISGDLNMTMNLQRSSNRPLERKLRAPSVVPSMSFAHPLHNSVLTSALLYRPPADRSARNTSIIHAWVSPRSHRRARSEILPSNGRSPAPLRSENQYSGVSITQVGRWLSGCSLRLHLLRRSALMQL